jgi:DNA anti-recombination protein RmuC
MEFLKSWRATKVPAGRLNGEIDELKEILVGWLDKIESGLQEAEGLAAAEAQRVQALKETVKTKVDTLETRLREKDEILSARDSALKELEEGFAAKIRDFENQLREKEEENSKLKERMSAEIEKVKSELLEKKILLAQIERQELRSMEQAEKWMKRLKHVVGLR